MLTAAATTLSATDWKTGNLHALAAKVALARGDAEAAITQARIALHIYDQTTALEPGRREKAQATLGEAKQLAARGRVP